MLKDIAKGALGSVGLLSPAIKTVRTLRTAGILPYPALVPIDAFSETCDAVVKFLSARGHQFGDYLEFGVSRGTSLACMFKALDQNGLSGSRLHGFDSFEGMPEEASGQGWQPGSFRSSQRTTEAYLKNNRVDMGRVTLTKGWFKDSLTQKRSTNLGLSKASILMLDCDIYSATAEALAFAGRFIQDEAVLIFDDWGHRSDVGKIGQREAYQEFLAANPTLAEAERLPGYTPYSRVFFVKRQQQPALN